ncbi:hypothetical protein LVJ82_08380 [Vitreoscilla massiliensis]|uniref:Uncharacterized protein n=1 Tax=Vitreoscilla massiliensis TaxID=1689272 RepID=A0ABY4E6R3_9NEIS|nr:hypothetical protein [Vitreoscilla massiliensis]UOO90964.1 hypothetical protein LVJ82_08380 [Vitreoscilla massiliensis]
MSYSRTLLLALSGLCLLPAAHASTDTRALLAKQFKSSGSCLQYRDEQQTDYCLFAGPSREVRIDGQSYLYALALGDAYDYAEKQTIEAHAYSGVAALFVYQKVGNAWQLRHKGKPEHIGAYGTAPRAKAWSLHQFGPKTYGYLSQHADMHHGYAGSHYVILTPWKQGVARSWLGASYNTEGASETGKKYADLDAKFYINTQGKTTAGMYPLVFKVNNQSNGKKHPQKTYGVPFNAAKGQYVAPKNFPLNDIDY